MKRAKVQPAGLMWKWIEIHGGIFLVAFLLVSPVRAELSVQTSVDQTVLGVGARFTLSVELSGSDMEAASSPQLPPMESFAKYLGSGSSQSVRIVNGSVSTNKTLNYYFQAVSEGTFEIQPVTVTAGGKKYSGRPITIEIRNTSDSRAAPQTDPQRNGSDKDLFIRATVSKARLYQNEPLIVTYQIYTRMDLSGYGISKLPDRTGFWMENLLGDQKQTPTTTEILNGKRYTVATIQKMALFPTTPGPKVLDPLEVDCQVRVRSRQGNWFGGFFDDPFTRTATYTRRSKPLQIEVLPLPQAGKPDDFQGAVGPFRISGGVDKNKVSVNDVVTLRFTIEGSGNIRTVPAPGVSFSPGLEVYEPKVDESVRASGGAVSGTRTYEYVLVPRTAGKKKVGAVSFSYFDPVDEKYKSASLDDIFIDVGKNSGTKLDEVEKEQPKEDVRLLAQEIRFIHLDSPAFQDIQFAFYKTALFWGTSLLPLLGILGSCLCRRHLDRLEGDVAYARRRRAGRQVRQHFKAAGSLLKTTSHKEFYAEVGRGLRGYVADRLNLSEAGMISEQLQAQLSQRDVSSEMIDQFMACLNTCDMKQFSPLEAGLDEMKAFLDQANQSIRSLNSELSK